MIFPKVRERSLTRDRLHTPNTGRHAAFLQNLDQADLSGLRGVRAAAKFGRKVANLDDADFVAILLAEQRHGVVFVHCHVDRHVLGYVDLGVAQDLLIDDVLNVLQLFVFNRGEVRKIKAQVIRRHQRSRLLHMLP